MFLRDCFRVGKQCLCSSPNCFECAGILFSTQAFRDYSFITDGTSFGAKWKLAELYQDVPACRLDCLIMMSASIYFGATLLAGMYTDNVGYSRIPLLHYRLLRSFSLSESHQLLLELHGQEIRLAIFAVYRIVCHSIRSFRICICKLPTDGDLLHMVCRLYRQIYQGYDYSPSI